MSNPFVQKEVDKIIEERQFQFPINMAMASAWIIANFKGMNIKIFDVSETSSLADYYLIGSAANPNQARAMVDEILSNLKRHNLNSLSIEGLDTGDWVLLDMGDLIIHIFLEYTRDIFDLDTLWAKYEQLTIPNEYYMNSMEVESASKDDSSGYF